MHVTETLRFALSDMEKEMSRLGGFPGRDEEENMCLGFISTTYDRHRFQGHAFAEWQSDSA